MRDAKYKSSGDKADILFNICLENYFEINT